MKNEDTIQVILLPKGYGKATKEVREYIHLLENRIDKAIKYINSFEYYIPEDNIEELIDILRGGYNE